MSRRFRRRFSPASIVAILLVAWVLVRLWQSARWPDEPIVLCEGVYQVARVVDGDTLLLSSGARIRLQGIDTPETVKPNHPVQPWGPQATDFTRRLVSGKQVRLQFDPERLDRHGRLLAYVWIEDRLLNEELLRAGLARAQPQYRFSPTMRRRFLRAEQEARDARRGMWSNQHGSL